MNGVDLMIFNNNTNSSRLPFSGSAKNVPSNFLKSVSAQNFLCAIFYQHSSISRAPCMKYVQTHFKKEHFCALQHFLCVLTSRPVCAPTHVHSLEQCFPTCVPWHISVPRER